MELTTLLSLLATILLTVLFLHSLKPQKNANTNGGFKTYPFLGSLPEFLLNRHRFLDWTTDVLSSLPSHTAVFFRPGGVHGVITADPSVVEHILKTRFPIYPKGPDFISLLHDFLGSGIFNSDDDLWLRQRKTAAVEFNNRSLKAFLLNSVRTEIQTRLIPLLQEASRLNRVLDLQDTLERFAFDNICKLAFNVDPSCLGSSKDGSTRELEFMRAFEEAAWLSSGRFMYTLPGLWKVKRFLNIGSERRLRDSIRTVHVFADEIIRKRLDEEEKKEEGRHNHDLLSRFIISANNGEKPDCKFLRDVVISFILAGRDTTSAGLTWFFWLLSLNPDVVEKIRAEVGRVRAQVGKRVGETFEFDELREMNYLHGAISESMRLYPPVAVDSKACLADDVLPDGTEVKKGWFVAYYAYAMGRMRSIWGEDCMEFRPERWIDDNGVYKPVDNPFRYPVFHGGPRICLGWEMAYIQMKSIVACVVEQFEIDVLGKETPPEFLLSLTLRKKGGLPVKVKERNV